MEKDLYASEMSNKLPDYFWADRLTPINFYGYTSSVRERVYELGYRDEDNESRQRFMDLKQKVMEMYVDMSREGEEPNWVRDVWDNKIVIECKTETGETIFVGWYDNECSIGKSMYSRDSRTPRPYCVNPSEVKKENKL